MRRLILLPALAAVLVLAGCSGDDEGASSGAPEPTAGAESTAVSTPTSPGATPAPSFEVPDVNLRRVFPNLDFERFVGLYPLPDGRWLALEQVGRIHLIDAAGGQAVEFLDITDRVASGSGEAGLLGLALAPDYEQSRAFYLDYTADGPFRTVISRFIANAGEGSAAAPGSETVLLEINQPFANHNGGQIAFGPDGYLYVALGDGGSGNDPMGNGQNLNALLGKLLRIDVSGDGGDYTVPSDNPFVGQQGARPEVWAYGLRNPWRFSFDTETGDLWAGDVGQGRREEIDIITKGGNYGWRIMEGTICQDDDECDTPGLIPPVIDYSSDGGSECSVTGGFVYRGDEIPALRGAYVYADYCSGKVWGLRTDGQRVENRLIADANFMISSFAQGNDGELYVLQYANNGGGIYQIVP